MTVHTLQPVKSKYIRSEQRSDRVVRGIAVFFLFSLFVMPQYFGIPFPLFDFTILRISLILLTVVIFFEKDGRRRLTELIVHSKLTKLLLPYIFVLGYTMVLRFDINAFLNPLIEFYTLFLLIYVIRYLIDYRKLLDILITFMYLLTILGLVEYAIGRSPFSYLETIKGTFTGAVVRSGNYRIMGPGVHALAYGLILVVMMPIICYDQKSKTVNLLQRKFLLLLVTVNIVLTGSRSTLGVFFVEVLLILLMSARQNKRKIIFFVILTLLAAGVLLVLFQNTGPGRYVMLQITSIADELFGTSYSAKYGAEESLGSSSNYREQLKYIFTLDWLNPIVGIGRKRNFSCEINGSFVASVDSQYIAEYVRYAYPGLIAYTVFQLYYLIRMFMDSRRKKDGIYKLLFVGALCYSINLLWVDSLQTFKYFYILIAVYISLTMQTEKEEEHTGYIRRRFRRKSQRRQHGKCYNTGL